ncbi:MAG: peptidylprolyl isomerase [Helicobacteraceae bacterium CG2_30_36_10]|nr:MAG: peptidylprolyl isomerase [Helicobacteraceae bacterium CG2_30_36_10]
MITWMQRHKKYLIITIWISTIAFVGAGFVGWGQYSYGDKAGGVAKVGNVEITMGELQKAYSNLYNQYNKVFQGNFDEEKAKSFGLKRQALQQLIDQSLILNLADSYDLQISDEELLAEIKTQEYFFDKNVFDKEIYKQVLATNNLKMKDYEADVRKQLLIRKTLNLLPVEVNENELAILDTVMKIADKINYKILSDEHINIDTSDAVLKQFWETMQHNFMSEVSYEVKYIKQTKVSNTYKEAKINEYYLENKTHFKDSEGKILPLEEARKAIISELNENATKDLALRAYIAYKKDNLGEDIAVQNATISASKNPFNEEVLENISKLSTASPFMKPILVNGEYFTFELVKINPSVVKTYKEAKAEVLPLYIQEKKKSSLLELANNSLATFNGKTTDFITSIDADKLKDTSVTSANEFLKQLFTQNKRRGYVTIGDGKVVLFNILEQKLLDNTNANQGDTVLKLKSAMFNEGLIKDLRNKYKTEIFIEGL